MSRHDYYENKFKGIADMMYAMTKNAKHTGDKVVIEMSKLNYIKFYNRMERMYRDLDYKIRIIKERDEPYQ